MYPSCAVQYAHAEGTATARIAENELSTRSVETPDAQVEASVESMVPHLERKRRSPEVHKDGAAR